MDSDHPDYQASGTDQIFRGVAQHIIALGPVGVLHGNGKIGVH
jgi:hypothetical protein